MHLKINREATAMKPCCSTLVLNPSLGNFYEVWIRKVLLVLLVGNNMVY